VVGCPRSGTTLLSVILDRHSQIAVTPETHFLPLFAPRFIGWNRKRPTAALAGIFCRDGMTRELSLSVEQLVARIATDEVTLPDLFCASLQEYATQRAKPFCVEKTPAHIFYVERLLQWYPRARIICIVRDGRDAVHSLGQLSHLLHTPRGHAAIWREAAVMTEKWNTLFTTQFCTVRYEDLLTEPEKTLTVVMQHFGLPFEPAQLQPTSSSAVISEWETTWKSNAIRELDASRVFAWRRHMSAARLQVLNSMMAGYLEKFGYEDPYARVSPSIAQAREGVINGFYRLLYHHRLIRCRRWSRQFLRRLFPAREPHNQPR
jgi:hypothetical protein